MMLFTVVIPLYNKRDFIKQTLDSLFAQSWSNFEVVVIDDGSKDGGADLIERAYLDSRLRVVRQANAGVSAARNRGIEEARGEWLAFLDADDCWHPSYLASLHELIGRHAGSDMVAAKLRHIPSSPTWTPEPWPSVGHPLVSEIISDLPTRWMQGSTFITSSVCVRASLLKRMQPCFPLGESNGEDLDLWFRVGELGPITWTPAELVAYRAEAAGSLSSQNKVLKEPPYLARMQQRAMGGKLPARLVRPTVKFVADQRISFARLAFIQADKKAAWHWLVSSKGFKFSRRWYVTLLMLMFLSPTLMKQWENWRLRRTHSAEHLD